MKLTDWRGNEYGVGDLVLYPRMSGRSCEVREARVLDIWQVHYDDYKWKRWTGEGPEPMKTVFDGWDDDGNRVDKEVSALETRIKLRPTGRSSRGFMDYSWRKDNGIDVKDVTLTIIENITALGG
ncbi:hypothetical protein E1264_03815 [Actinomadura sp. KC216]|uniref:hypothetical protein n=1 Tax=Actinomadura sp. KC216 TaxID=2530370 RepID=UPI001046781F|nr:hypothetical protein [Actinomadura sp. KC216]TDB90942.1 hypothetical protein E1264_03815 [Actinomadura sp. KC216]